MVYLKGFTLLSMHYSGHFWSIERPQKSEEECVKFFDPKSLVKIEYQLGDSPVLSLLLKILQPTTLAICEQQLDLVDVIEMTDCLSPSSTSISLGLH